MATIKELKKQIEEEKKKLNEAKEKKELERELRTLRNPVARKLKEYGGKVLKHAKKLEHLSAFDEPLEKGKKNKKKKKQGDPFDFTNLNPTGL